MPSLLPVLSRIAVIVVALCLWHVATTVGVVPAVIIGTCVLRLVRQERPQLPPSDDE